MTSPRAMFAACRCAVLASLGILTAGASAAESAFIVREWHREDGLPSEWVLDVTEDRQGYLWLATGAGLVRFDGRDFELRVPSERLHPTHPPLLAVMEDGDGLWLVPRGAEPLDYRNGVLTRDPLPDGYADKTITTAFIAPDGSRWLALRDSVVLHHRAGKFETFDAASGIDGKRTTRFATDGRGRVWISSDRFLGRYEEGRIVPVDAGTNASELRVVSSATEGPWVITQDRVLKLDDRDQPHLIRALPQLLGAHYVAAACEDRGGGLWLGTRSQGVHRVTPDAIEHVPTSHENIHVVREDSEGNIWVGTNIGGLDAIGPRILKLYDKTSGLIENAAYAVCEAPDGAIWFANGDGGIVKLHDNHVTVVAREMTWPRLGVVAIGATPANHLIFGSAQGMFEFTPTLGAAPTSLTPPVSDGVRRLFVDSAGDIWASADPNHVGRRTAAGDYRTYGSEDGFTGGDVRCFAQDEKGTLWIGTNQGRVFRREGARFAAVPFSTPHTIGAINAIVFAGDGDLWLGTAQAGIVITHSGETRILDTAAGLPDNAVTQMLPDDRGFLWCGSSNAIFRVNRNDVARFAAGTARSIDVVRLGRDEGLKYVSCAGIYFPGAVKARDGRLWFTTRQGLLAIDPSAPLLSSTPRRVSIEEIAVDDRKMPFTPVLTLEPETKKLQIRFSILSLSAPRRIHAQYRLDGFDSEWAPVGNANTASYPRLSPGHYRFHLRAGPADESIEETLSIIVLQPWWQNPWIIGLAVILVLAIVGLAVRTWSTRRLRRQLEELERERAVERERARIAQNIHDDVGASLTHISLLTQSAARDNSPEKLQQIYETTRDVTRSLDEIVWATNPQHDTLESFANYLAPYSQRFLRVANIRCRLDIPDELPAISLTSELRHHLFLCCREALNNIVKHAQADEAIVRLAISGHWLTIAITDDGEGLQLTGPAIRPDGGGNGLNNMRRRMDSLGGEFTIDLVPGRRGTAVSFRVNLK